MAHSHPPIPSQNSSFKPCYFYNAPAMVLNLKVLFCNYPAEQPLHYPSTFYQRFAALGRIPNTFKAHTRLLSQHPKRTYVDFRGMEGKFSPQRIATKRSPTATNTPAQKANVGGSGVDLSMRYTTMPATAAVAYTSLCNISGT